MSNQIATDRRANLLGSLWMVLSMAAFAVEDSFLKGAAFDLPVAQVLVLFGLGGVVVFGTWAMIRGEPLLSSDVVSRPMRIRVLFEVMGRLFYLIAIALTPLSSATVILQATPLVVVAAAAVIFGEKVGWRRWLAIGIGLAGVMLIVQPGSEGFSALSLLAVMGMLGFAGRDLASRAAPATLSTAVLGFYGFWAVVVAGAIYAAWEQAPFVWPGLTAGLCMLAAIGSGVVGYSALMKAMRTGEVSAVTPFRYTRLIFGVALGVIVFGESLSVAMLMGCGLIVLSGLFILWRGRNA